MRWVHRDECAGISGAREPPSPARPSAPSEPAAGEPKDGGTLVVAIPGDINRTDPALIDDSNSSYVMQQRHGGPRHAQARHGRRDRARPRRELGPVSDDGLTYTFKIREGVKFHDGTDLDAAAVKYNFDRWLNIPTDLQDYTYYAGAVFGGYGDGSNIASTDAPDADDLHRHAEVTRTRLPAAA